MSRKQKFTNQELIVLAAEVQARWLGTMVERGLIPVACVCMRNVDSEDAATKGAIVVLADREIDENILSTVLDKMYKCRNAGLVQTVHLK